MSPSRLFRTLVCRAPLVIGTAVVVASIVLLASFGTPTSYDAHALARLGPLPADATAGARAPSSPERAQALASDRVLRAVTDELRRYDPDLLDVGDLPASIERLQKIAAL